jgi:hypothetical protein
MIFFLVTNDLKNDILVWTKSWINVLITPFSRLP